MTHKQNPLDFHRSANGKIRFELTQKIETQEQLALTYTPGVAEVSREIARDKKTVWNYTGRRNRVAIVSDGSAVLGLGDIGPEAALPVMEGKAALFKQFANVDAFPLCIATNSTEEIVQTVKAIAPSFGGINLEDIKAPRCFEVEKALKQALDIPVFHDDQHGTAIVLLAGLMNALKVTGRCDSTGPISCSLDKFKIVISGAGAAGSAITRILLAKGAVNILVCDSKGIIGKNRSDVHAEKAILATLTNPESIEGSLEDAMHNADIFIGVSAPNLVTKEMVQSMNADPIIFAMANPDPEILPKIAKAAGAKVVATGRSDFPNQVNNLLAFPGVFRGALDAGATDITEEMKLAAAAALASCVENPNEEHILPDPLEDGVAQKVAEAVRNA